MLPRSRRARRRNERASVVGKCWYRGRGSVARRLARLAGVTLGQLSWGDAAVMAGDRSALGGKQGSGCELLVDIQARSPPQALRTC